LRGLVSLAEGHGDLGHERRRAGAHLLDLVEFVEEPQRTGLRRLACGQRLAEDGYGSGIADPGGLTSVIGDLPALHDQPVLAAVDADLPGFGALTADHDALVLVGPVVITHLGAFFLIRPAV